MRLLFAAAIVLHGSVAAAQQSTTLVGRILRAGSGAELPNAEVTVTPPNARAVTDADGEFRIEGLKAGPVVIQVRRLGFVPESVTVELPLAGAIEIDLRETPSINPAELAALEFYGGPAQTPAQYNTTGSACGVLLIWTK